MIKQSKRRFSMTVLHLGGVGLVAIHANMAWAQTAASDAAQPAQIDDTQSAQVDDIVVTAQRRSERLQDVPIAVTALTSKTLVDRRILHVVDLSNVTPDLQIKSGDDGANPRIFICNVGVNA